MVCDREPHAQIYMNGDLKPSSSDIYYEHDYLALMPKKENGRIP